MKFRILTIVAFMFLAAGSIFAQDSDGKMKDMKHMNMMKDNPEMMKMMKSPHHKMMMAYHHNIHSFAKVLKHMSKDGNTYNAKFAKDSVKEMKRSSKMMDKIHENHMSKMKAKKKMDADKMAKMAPMMAKMKKKKAELDGHIAALDRSVTAGNKAEVNQHASAIAKMTHMKKKGKKHKRKMKMDKMHKMDKDHKMKMDKKDN